MWILQSGDPGCMQNPACAASSRALGGNAGRHMATTGQQCQRSTSAGDGQWHHQLLSGSSSASVSLHGTSPTKPRQPSRVTFCPVRFLPIASSWFGVSRYGLALQQPNSPINPRGAGAVMVAGYPAASLPKISCKTSYLRRSCVSHPHGWTFPDGTHSASAGRAQQPGCYQQAGNVTSRALYQDCTDPIDLLPFNLAES